MDEYMIFVTTGRQPGAGTDANISIIIQDTSGHRSGPHSLDKLFRDDFEAGQTDDFKVKVGKDFGDFAEIELIFQEKWSNADWYCEKVKVEHMARRRSYIIPVHRWFTKSMSLKLVPFDSHLPQHSKHTEQRAAELDEKRKVYEYAENGPGLPLQIKEMPAGEAFSDDLKWDLMKRKFTLITEKVWVRIWERNKRFVSMDKVMKMFEKFPSLEAPPGVSEWKDDAYFAQQRLSGCNPKVISLCTEIPEKFNIEKGRVEELLEGLTLHEALESKRLFIVDLSILEGIGTVKANEVKDGKEEEIQTVLCAPIALFFVSKQDILKPIAIQLFQSKGPVFYPTDDEYLWLMVKMWYNHADSSYHQSCVHLTSTHLLMEGISICTNRTLSPSHPVFRLLAPHFLYIIAINTLGLQKLLSPGGWIDSTMTLGRDGMFQLMAKRHESFNFEIDGDFKEDLKQRGVLEDILPNYYYRKDGLRIYDAIDKYVRKMIDLFYPNEEDIKKDHELQNWALELGAPREAFQGLGLKGVPGNGRLDNHEDLIKILRIIIFACSCEHAASNFNQYDSYAFPPNYPAFLFGQPPSDKSPRTEQDIIDSLPTKAQMMDAMVITKLLSTRSTQPLGDFEVQYHHDRRVLKIVREFQDELWQLSSVIKGEKVNRVKEYDILDPEIVPNSISI